MCSVVETRWLYREQYKIQFGSIEIVGLKIYLSIDFGFFFLVDALSKT